MAVQRSAPVQLTGADAFALRAALADWTIEAVTELVGQRAARALDREQIVPARMAARMARGDRVSALTRLFTLGDALTRRELELALTGAFGVDDAERAGLVVCAGASGDDPVRALVDLRPYATDVGGDPRHWWLASDRGEAVTSHELLDDHVLGVGGASLTLASATMRAPVARVLDLGTGCGIQALHAAGHAREVIATDTSTRALAFAAFNIALNADALGVGHGGAAGATAARILLREGSLLEPVAGEAFDLVVSNPPFVITPAGTPSFEYRDSGFVGDGVMRALVSGVGSVLAPGGVAQMLGNWEIRAGETWSDRLEPWLDAAASAGHAVDAWVVQRDALDAAEYAETWLRDAGITPERGRERHDDAYEAYLLDFDRRGIEAIGFGIVTLRRPAAERGGWRRFEELEGPMQEPIGPHLAASLAARDWLDALDDAALMGERLVIALDVTRETYGLPSAPDPEHILLRQGGGFGRAVRADTALAGFVSACDGELAAGQIAHALAGLLDVPAATMLGGLVPAVRELVLDGFLERASSH